MFDRCVSRAGRGLLALTLALTGVCVLTTAPTASAAVDSSVCTRSTATDPTGQTLIGRWNSGRTVAFSVNQRWCAYDEYSNRRIVWQQDGNLVIYSNAFSGGTAVGQSRTSGIGAALRFQTDGNVVVYDAAGRARWALQVLAADIDHQYWHGYSGTADYRFYLQQRSFGGPGRVNLIVWERRTPSLTSLLWKA